MPGRHGYAAQSGWAVGGNGSSLPASLSINSRIGNVPSEYKASESIEFTESFESGTADEFEAYITEAGSGGGTINGVDGEEGLYRYGFNGKEMDGESKGSGNQYDYGERIYDPRVGRFLSVDPLTKSYPMLTPYQYASNNPIWMIDLDGLEGVTFSDVWHGRANVVDWLNDPSTWTKGAQNVNEAANPLYQAYEHGYEITTGKDARTGEEKGRGRAVADAGVDVMGWLTFGRFIKTTTVTTALEAKVAQNTRAMGKPAAKANQAVAVEATESKVQSTVSKSEIPGRVQSRVNVANGTTRFTPLRKSGEPVSAGFEHVLGQHFKRPNQGSRSIFTITPDELKSVLNSKTVVQSPVTAIEGGQYVRTVDVGRAVGVVGENRGGGSTNWLQVITDKAGNLITSYPVKR